jgi:hypothetical protein
VGSKVCVVHRRRWQVVEPDGAPCVSWLPGLENDDDQPLDRGGFASEVEAVGFCLAINWERAYRGTLPGMTTQEIDRVRRLLDRARPTRAAMAEVRRIGVGMLCVAG